MADAGTKATDDIIEELEKQLHQEYSRAAKETTAKLDDYLRRFQIKDEIKRKALQEGKITKEYYQYWRTGQILIGERWKEMANTLATDLANVDAIARSTVKGYMMDVYALNHGYATFEIERDTLLDTSYTLYNRDTVQNLWKNNPKLLPDPVPGSPTAKMLEEHEDMRWNRDNLQAELVQGILQGESIPQLAARMQNVTDMDERSAVRNARTMCTGAMNKGRLDGYQRAKDMGIEVKKVWSATHDGRTRKSHAAQDGEAVDLDKEFPNGCMYPGDPDADPSEVYNCRCSMNCESERSKHSYYMQDLWASMRRGEDIVPYQEWVEKKEQQSKTVYRTFKSGDDAKKFFNSQRPDRSLIKTDKEEYNRLMGIYRSSDYYKWYDGLSMEQIGSIGSYSGDGYSGINGLLRHEMTEKMVDAWNQSERYSIQDMIGNIDAALDGFTLSEPIKVYRTCEKDVLASLKLESGSIFEDQGYVSTSILQEKVASGNIFMEISVPAGTGHGAWINELSGASDEEYEYLLPRGSVFEVGQIEQRGEDTIVHMKWIGADPKEYSYATKDEVIQRWKEKGLPTDEEYTSKI